MYKTLESQSCLLIVSENSPPKSGGEGEGRTKEMFNFLCSTSNTSSFRKFTFHVLPKPTDDY